MPGLAVRLSVASAALISLSAFAAAAQAPAAKSSSSLPLGPQTISGTVTSPHGPEAGVWVIAETTDLPTQFMKIVVTDDKGRYVLPDLPRGELHASGCAAMGSSIRPKMHGVPGKRLDLSAVLAPNAADGGAILSGDLLVFDAEDSRRRASSAASSAHSRQGRRPRRLAHHHQEPRLRRLPSARAGSDAHACPRRSPASWIPKQAWIRRVQSGQAAPVHGRTRWPARLGGVPLQVFRRLDRRASPRARCRMRSRRGRKGVERDVVITEWEWGSDRHLSPRSDLDRQAQPDGQRLWPDLRLAGIFDRRSADPRSQDQHGQRLQGAGARSGHAGDRSGPAMPRT